MMESVLVESTRKPGDFHTATEVTNISGAF